MSRPFGTLCRSSRREDYVYYRHSGQALHCLLRHGRSDVYDTAARPIIPILSLLYFRLFAFSESLVGNGFCKPVQWNEVSWR